MKLFDLFGPLTEAVGGYFKRKHELRMKKLDLKEQVEVAKAQAKIDIEKTKVEGALSWELLSIQNSGWKDEYVTLVFTIPFILIFIPYLQPFIIAGFAALAQLPYWYQVVLMGIISSALGIRLWNSITQPLKLGKAVDALPKKEAQPPS